MHHPAKSIFILAFAGCAAEGLPSEVATGAPAGSNIGTAGDSGGATWETPRDTATPVEVTCTTATSVAISSGGQAAKNENRRCQLTIVC